MQTFLRNKQGKFPCLYRKLRHKILHGIREIKSSQGTEHQNSSAVLWPHGCSHPHSGCTQRSEPQTTGLQGQLCIISTQLPWKSIYQNQNLSGSRCQVHRNKKDRLLNKCCLESGFHTLSRSCLIEVALIFPTSKHAFIIADNFYSYNVLLIVLD